MLSRAQIRVPPAVSFKSGGFAEKAVPRYNTFERGTGGYVIPFRSCVPEEVV